MKSVAVRLVALKVEFRVCPSPLALMFLKCEVKAFAKRAIRFFKVIMSLYSSREPALLYNCNSKLRVWAMILVTQVSWDTLVFFLANKSCALSWKCIVTTHEGR